MLTARDRLLQTARNLFVKSGVPNVGINTVTETAKVARMTLYNNFASKDELVLAVFKAEAEDRRKSIKSLQSQLEGPIEKTMALFLLAQELAALRDFRGCAFINLSIGASAPESSFHRVARDHKHWVLQNIRQQLPEDAFKDRDLLSEQILVLWDGGIVGAYVHQSVRPILAARAAAQALLRIAAC